MDNNNCTCDEWTVNSCTEFQAVLRINNIVLSFMILAFGLALFFIYSQQSRFSRRRKAIILPTLEKLKANHSSISPEKKEQVEKCKEKIRKVLGPDRPGRYKYIDAWKQWITEDDLGLETTSLKKIKSSWFGPTVYKYVEMSMGFAEHAMQTEREGKGRFLKAMTKTVRATRKMESGDPKANKKYKKAVKHEKWMRELWETEEKEMEEDVENAALMWAIFWPQEVEKEKAKQAAKRLKKESEMV